MLSINKTGLAISLLTLSSVTFAVEQDAVIVTATRTAQTIDETLSSVTVITEEQIKQQQPHDLVSLLTSVNGIDMTNQGGMGKLSSIFMRGTNSSHLLVMIDGMKIGSATSGTIPFQHIPVSQIERIEIVRGPRASLYGSEAIGGVIQIFTKKGKEKLNSHIDLGYGTYATQRLSAGLSGKSNNTSYAFNASQLKTDGFTTLNGTETDLDGYQNNSISLNLSHALSDTSALALNVLQASGETEYDGSYQDSTNYVEQTTGIQYTFAPSQNWDVKLNASQSLDQADNFKDAVLQSKFNSTRDNLSWQNNIVVADNQLLTLGVDYQNDSVDSSTNYNKTSRYNTAGFVQHQWFGENNDMQVSARNDNNQNFGSHNTGSIAWGHDFENKYRLITSYGTAFKAPTFNDLYYPGYSNENLKPEESNTVEVEVRKSSDWGKWSVNAYHTNITNLIVFVGSAPINVNKASISGVELSLSTLFAGYNTQFEVAALDPRDKETNKLLQRRTQRTVKIIMDKEHGKWASGFTITGQGNRYDDKNNANLLKGYVTFDTRARYAISKSLHVKAKIENLFDKKYETVKGYNNPERSVFVSLSYTGF